jgi:PKD repeat protein
VSAKSFLYQHKYQFRLTDMSIMKALVILSVLCACTLVAISELTLSRLVVGASQERIAGVEVGDWVKYGNFHASWSSNDPNAQEPPLDLIKHNNTEWVRNTVQGILGTQITFQAVTHWKNGTETTIIAQVDVNSGEGNGTQAFASANLGPGESVYNSTKYANSCINETLRLVYANALRETNYLEATTTQVLTSGMMQTLVLQVEYFWDKTTGVLSERAGTLINYTGDYHSVAIVQEFLVDTSLWEGNPDTTSPLAKAGPDQTVFVDQTVSFDAGGSSDNKGGWGIASYEWDFGDGTQSTEMIAVHSFNVPGKYTVTLTVKDWSGNSDEDALTITVQEASSPPSYTGVIVLIILLAAGLAFWLLKVRR